MKITEAFQHLPSPAWEDGRAIFVSHDPKFIMIAHPAFPPHAWDFKDQRFREIKAFVF